ADALHSLFPLAPVAWRRKLLVTVHDLQPLLDPQFTGNRARFKKSLYDLYYRTVYPITLHKADYLICDSYATKDFLIQLFPDLVSRVLVVHGGVDPEAFKIPSEEQIERAEEKFNLPARYLFYLGSTRPNKNLETM